MKRQVEAEGGRGPGFTRTEFPFSIYFVPWPRWVYFRRA